MDVVNRFTLLAGLDDVKETSDQYSCFTKAIEEASEALLPKGPRITYNKSLPNPSVCEVRDQLQKCEEK